MNILGIKKKNPKNKGREEMKGETDRTGAVSAFFVLVLIKLIMIRHIMKLILRRG